MASIADTYIENRSRVQPNHANSHGTVYGGNVMKWIDEVGAMSAIRATGETCVTARMDGIDFHSPVPVGETVLIESYAYDTGRTSVRVRVSASRENPRTGASEAITESTAVFVAVDNEGAPTPVPELTVETERGRRLRDAALSSE